MINEERSIHRHKLKYVSYNKYTLVSPANTSFHLRMIFKPQVEG